MWRSHKKQLPSWAGHHFLRPGLRRRFRLLVEELEPRNSPAGLAINNLQITTDPGVQQQPSIAVDPQNSNHLVMAYMDYSLVNAGYTATTGYAGIGTQESTDGGATWSKEVAVPLPIGYDEGAANPVVQFDDQGHVFVSFMAVTFKGTTASALTSGEFEDRGVAGTTSNNGIFEARSNDGGVSWNAPVTIVSHQYDGSTSVFFEDLPQLAIDTSPVSPNFGYQYEVWTRVYPAGGFPNEPTAPGGTDIMIAVSKDGGRSWQTQFQNYPGLALPVTALADFQDTAGGGGGTGNSIGLGFVDQPHVAVGPDGSVYVAYVGVGDFSVAYSAPSEAGSSFLTPDYKSSNRLAFGTLGNIFVNELGIGNGDYFRTFPVREIVADPTRPGTVYAVSAEQIFDANGNPLDAGDILFARSTDYGVTWTSKFDVGTTPASVLNDDNGGQSVSTDVIDAQAQPRLAVDSKGNISVIWYDTRRDPAGQNLDVFGTASTDGGMTFSPNFRVTSQSFNPNLGAFKNPTTQPGGPEIMAYNFATSTLGDASGQLNYFLGEFPGLAMANGTVYAAWTDTRNNSGGSTGNQDIYFAQYPATPAPAPTNDRLEPNGTPAQATDLGARIQLLVPMLALPVGDEDWFRVVSAATGNLIISAASSGNIGLAPNMLQLQFYDENGDLLPTTESDLENASGNFIGQSLSYPSAIGQTFLVRVFRTDTQQTTTTSYELSLQSLTKDLGAQVVVDQTDTLAAGGEAVYKLTAAATGSLQVQLSNGANVQGNLTVDIEDPTTAASLILPPMPATLVAPEPNDSIGQADPTDLNGLGSVQAQGVIGDGLYANTTGDYDFYKLSAGIGQQLLVKLAPTPGSALDGVILLYDSSGNLIQQVDKHGPSVSENLSYITAAADTYYVAVYGSVPNSSDGLPSDPSTPGTGGGVPPSEGAYTLTITLQATGAGAVQHENIPVQQGQTVLLKVTGDNGTSSGDYDLGIVNLDQFTTTDIASLVFPAGAGPSQVVVGDLNGDGKPDLVISNTLSNTVSVLLNNGDATFQAPQQYAVGSFKTPSEVAVEYGLTTYRRPLALADLTNDGKLDIVVANYDSGDISVLLNRGDGTFEPQLRFDTGSTPFGLAIGDLTGNGVPDVVTIDSTSDGNTTVSVLLGRGDGTFLLARTFPAGDLSAYPLTTVTLADLTNDGKLDLIISGSNNYDLQVLVGNGDGTFQAAQHYPAGRLGSSVAVADINNDGQLDIVTTAIDPSGLAFLLGEGNGEFTATFNPSNNLPVFPAGQVPVGIAVADFGSQVSLPDGSVALGPPDGHPDLIIADSGITEGAGGQGPPGIFVAPTLWDAHGSFAGLGVPELLASAIQPQDMALAYLTGETQGVSDVIVTDEDGVRVIYAKNLTIAPNNTPQTARNLGTVVHVEEQTLTIVPGHEEDYYTLAVPTEAVTNAAEVLDFSGLFQDEAGAGLGMEVLDPFGNVVATGERFRVVARQGEIFTLHVFGKTAADGSRGAGAYTLDIDTLPQVVSAQAEALLPGAGAQPGGPTASLVITLQGDRLDPDTVQVPANYTVTWAGPDGVFGTADDQALPKPISVVYDGSTNVDIDNGVTYPTAVRQTITLLYEQPLQPGSYRIDLSPTIQTAPFNDAETSSLTSTAAIPDGHALVAVDESAVVPGGQAQAEVAAPSALGTFAGWPEGTAFFTQLHDDLGDLLDQTLTAQGGANDQDIPTEIDNQIIDRFTPALAPPGQRQVGILVIWLDPRPLAFNDSQGNGVSANLPGFSRIDSLQNAFFTALGNIDVVVTPIFAGTTQTYQLTLGSGSPTARGGLVYFGSDGFQIRPLTDAIRSGQTSFQFTYGIDAGPIIAPPIPPIPPIPLPPVVAQPSSPGRTDAPAPMPTNTQTTSTAVTGPGPLTAPITQAVALLSPEAAPTQGQSNPAAQVTGGASSSPPPLSLGQLLLQIFQEFLNWFNELLSGIVSK